tara:strand:+ start:894 stop:1835 length:942 start_codon:yes stop_codon:yes gene_type:complete
MATTVDIVSSSYSGEFAGKYVSAALLSGNTIASGLIEVKPNVKFKEVLKRVEIDGIVADATCDFNDTSTVTLTERVLQPKELQVNLELCKTPFQSDWEAVSMGYSAHDNLPKTFSDYFIGQMSAKVAAKTELDIWSGTAGAGSFDGFATLLAADSAHTGSQKITGEAVDASNVVVNLGNVIDAIPEQLLQNENLYVYVANNVYRAYKRALGGFAAGGQGANGYMAQGNNQNIDVQMFDGIKVVPVNGLPSNRMIATVKDNLYFGTGLLSDFNECKVIDTAAILGDKNVRFVMRYTAGVQYSVVEDIVTFGLGL